MIWDFGEVVDADGGALAKASGASVTDSVLVEELTMWLGAVDTNGQWQVTRGDVWCSVAPHDWVPRPQGWKLHLSATLASAQPVLARSLPELLEARCAFKFLSTIELVEAFNARTMSRAMSGKFITIYPQSDEQAVRLADVLHQVTAGFAGPASFRIASTYREASSTTATARSPPTGSC